MNIDNVREFHRRQEEAFRLAAQGMELLGDPSNQVDHLHKNADFHDSCVRAIDLVISERDAFELLYDAVKREIDEKQT